MDWGAAAGGLQLGGLQLGGLQLSGLQVVWGPHLPASNAARAQDTWPPVYWVWRGAAWQCGGTLQHQARLPADGGCCLGPCSLDRVQLGSMGHSLPHTQERKRRAWP